MKGKIFYWLKSYLGFSNKESRGFLFLIPFLSLLIVVPTFLEHVRKEKAKEFHLNYIEKIDSLESAGVNLISSPDPLFNTQDTIRTPDQIAQQENLRRISILEADSVTLQIVPGIGPSLASRIIKYQHQLGGFHSPNQLLEVYGLKEETVQEIWNYFEFEPLISKRINLNSSEITELAKHPYISYSEAKVLVAYRNQHGDYETADDLLNIKIFKPSWVEKINPYLAF